MPQKGAPQSLRLYYGVSSTKIGGVVSLDLPLGSRSGPSLPSARTLPRLTLSVVFHPPVPRPSSSSITQSQLLMTAEFHERTFASFMPHGNETLQECKEQFIQSFATYARAVMQDKGAKYRLRKSFLEQKTISAIERFPQHSCRTINGTRPSCVEMCAWVTACHHMHDIGEVFDGIQGDVFVCKHTHNGTKAEPRNIQLDYLSYLFFEATQGKSISISFVKTDLEYADGSLRLEVEGSECDTIVETTKNGKKVTQKVHIEVKSLSIPYKEALQSPGSEALVEIDTQIREGTAEAELRTSKVLRAHPLFSLESGSINIVSLISGRRMTSGVVHKDCKHSNVFIFDLEGMVLGLHKHSLKGVEKPASLSEVKCLFCPSKFTTQNLVESAILFSRVAEMLLLQPFYHGRLYFEDSSLLRKHESKALKLVERALQRLKNPGDTKTLQTFLRTVRISLNTFWKKDLRTLYKKNQQKVSKPINVSIDYEGMHYPVRCIYCRTPEFTDLWEQVEHCHQHQLTKESQNSGCKLCNQEFEDADFPEDYLYLDLGVYELMQHRLKHIVHYPNISLRYPDIFWLPDIARIEFQEGVHTVPLDFVVNYLTINGRSKSKEELAYFRQDFKLKVPQKGRNYRVFVRESCMTNYFKSCSEHIIMVCDSDNLSEMMRCPKCKEAPFSILDIFHVNFTTNHFTTGGFGWPPTIKDKLIYTRFDE